MSTPRKLVDYEVDSLSFHDFDYTTLGNVLKMIQSLVDTHGADCKLNKTTRMYEDSEYLAIMKPRLETDAEYEARQAQEAKWAEHQRVRDVAEFERLTKLLGK
jgi:hypothetical protein